MSQFVPSRHFQSGLLFDRRWKRALSSVKPSWQKDWLEDQNSLTARIEPLCSEGFNVRVLSHQFLSASTEAAKVLEIQRGATILQRQVLLRSGDKPLIFACSLLPKCALIGNYAELKTLGSRPLGHWLFSEPVLRRLPMHYARFIATELPEELALKETVAARKTIFIGAKKPFLVSEFYLPSLRLKLD